MDIQKIHQYKSAFDQIAKEVKDDDGNSIEVWYDPDAALSRGSFV